MKCIEFREKLAKLALPIFSLKQGLRILSASYDSGKNQLSRWTKKGYLVRLKNGLYAVSDIALRGHLSEYLIANMLYQPSYVSLEAALSYYGLIPELVYNITSITPKPTRRFKVGDTTYIYRTLMPKSFTGYRVAESDSLHFRIAELEKALVDYYYFSLLDKSPISDRLVISNFNRQKLLHYGSLFNNQKLIVMIKKDLC